MIIPLNESLLTHVPHFCLLSPRHIAYESAYSILSRFALFNVVHGAPLVKLFKPKPDPRPRAVVNARHLSNSQSISADGMQLLRLSDGEADSLFLNPTFKINSDQLSPVLRFCPVCLSQGRHYSIFQFEPLLVCPVHRLELSNRCPRCRASTGFELNSKLFKIPYGCWRCGKQLGAERNTKVLSFLSEYGSIELENAYTLFELGKIQKVSYELSASKVLGFDNVLQLSMSMQKFAATESSLYSALQRFACAPDLNEKVEKLPGFLERRSFEKADQLNFDLVAEELVNVAKAVFRRFKRIHLRTLKLSKNLLSLHWRELEGLALPRHACHAAAYIDWSCRWQGVCVPQDLLRSEGKALQAMRDWLAEKTATTSLAMLSSGASKSWALKHILASEICMLLRGQIQQLDNYEASDTGQIKYIRQIQPVCWALFFTRVSEKHQKINFLSASTFQSEYPSFLAQRSALTTNISAADYYTLFKIASR